MKVIRYLFLAIVCCQTFLVSCSQAVKRPFYDQIQEFKDGDKRQFPDKDAILFVGSSSIRLWKDLESDFPDHKVMNRGFGGSGLDHAIMYADDIIIPYHPKQIVIYSGENDIAGGKVNSGDIIYRFKRLFNKIRKDLPDAHVVFISIKPSPSRVQFMPIMKESNQLIKDFLATQKNTVYVDVYSLMLDSKGNPRPELFVADQLHMNKKGYAIWKKAVEPVLMRGEK